MRTITAIVAATLCLTVAQAVTAGGVRSAGSRVGTPSCCGDCGCNAKCRQVTCQIVCGTKKVEKLCWDVKCENYCLPIPVLGSALHKAHASKCGPGCDACEDCRRGDGCGIRDIATCSPDVTCGHLRTKKKLMVRKITVEVPVYKCKLRYLCGACEAETRQFEPGQSEPAPKTAMPILHRF